MFPIHVWPVPIIPTNRKPVISNPFNPAGSAYAHYGSDFVFRRLPSEPQSKLPFTSRSFAAPAGTPILATSAGTVEAAYTAGQGGQVIIDHGSNYRTFYSHLARVDVKKGQKVKTGQQLGIMGDSPAVKGDIRHLHFEVWRGRGSARVKLDPGKFTSGAKMLKRSSSTLRAILGIALLGSGAFIAYKLIREK